MLLNANSRKNLCSTTDFLCTARSRLLSESADKLFSKIQLPITTKLQLLNVQHNFCSVMNANFEQLRHITTVNRENVLVEAGIYLLELCTSHGEMHGWPR